MVCSKLKTCQPEVKEIDEASVEVFGAVRTASANSMESDLGCTLRVYFDNVMLMSHNLTLTSQKPCQ